MLVLPNSAANLAQTEDVVTEYADLAQSEAQLGLALSALSASGNSALFFRNSSN